MPDPEILSERIEASNPSRQPINDLIGKHDFVESEFAPGSNRCDRCGGGPEAEIHLKKVDPLERIANRLDALAENGIEGIADTLERIADARSNGNVGVWILAVLICWGIGIWLGYHIPR